MSALTPITDMRRRVRHVRSVPEAVINLIASNLSVRKGRSLCGPDDCRGSQDDQNPTNALATKGAHRFLIVVFVVCMLNFAVFWLISVSNGGSAPNGKIEGKGSILPYLLQDVGPRSQILRCCASQFRSRLAMSAGLN